MALSKSDKSGSNVTKLDDARARRAKSSSGSDRKDSSGANQAEQQQSALAADTGDTLDENSGKKAKKVSNRRFDTVKVERLKGEIARGEYKIDYLHIADKFIEHERYS